MLWLALLALGLIATLFCVCACILAGRADAFDYSPDEIADAGDVWLASVASAAKAGSDRGEVGAGNIRAGRGGVGASSHAKGEI